MGNMLDIIKFVIHVQIVHMTSSARLLLMPANIGSHVEYFGHLASGLGVQGHQVTLLFASTARTPSWWKDTEGAVILKYDTRGRAGFMSTSENSRAMMSVATSTSFFSKYRHISNMVTKMSESWEQDCHDMYADRDVMTYVRGRGFDLAVVDMSLMTCGITLPYGLDVPYVMFSAYLMPWCNRIPSLPSFVPGGMGAMTDTMTFTERLTNAVSELTAVMLTSSLDADADRNQARYAPWRPRLGFCGIAGNARMWFYLTDVAVGFPKPFMPNSISIGDLMSRPASPLPPNIAAFTANSSRDVVLVSFGSYLDHLPAEILDKFCAAFRATPQSVIWKLNSSFCQEEGEILTLPWLPQNDVLGDSHVRLFITHGGINSLIEAVNHRVPVIVFPLSLDQPRNAAFVTSRGIGDVMDIADFTPEVLVRKMNDVINDVTIAENIREASKVLNDKPETAARRASFWINHVIKHGGKHMRTGAHQLSVTQFYMVDVYITLMMISCMFITATAIILRYFSIFILTKALALAKNHQFTLYKIYNWLRYKLPTRTADYEDYFTERDDLYYKYD